MKSLLIISVFVCFLVSVFGYGTIPISFKGNTLSAEEYEELDLCMNPWCLKDANRILLEMSYNNSIDPCEDFDEFTCGTFYRERAHNERYSSVGFEENYRKLIDEKRDRMLKILIKGNDLKIVKVTKNFYQRCVNWSKYRW